jgi:dynein heavy chain 1, cytosolic
MMVGPSGSGKS